MDTPIDTSSTCVFAAFDALAPPAPAPAPAPAPDGMTPGIEQALQNVFFAAYLGAALHLASMGPPGVPVAAMPTAVLGAPAASNLLCSVEEAIEAVKSADNSLMWEEIKVCAALLRVGIDAPTVQHTRVADVSIPRLVALVRRVWVTEEMLDADIALMYAQKAMLDADIELMDPQIPQIANGGNNNRKIGNPTKLKMQFFAICLNALEELHVIKMAGNANGRMVLNVLTIDVVESNAWWAFQDAAVGKSRKTDTPFMFGSYCALYEYMTTNGFSSNGKRKLAVPLSQDEKDDKKEHAIRGLAFIFSKEKLHKTAIRLTTTGRISDDRKEVAATRSDNKQARIASRTMVILAGIPLRVRTAKARDGEGAPKRQEACDDEAVPKRQKGPDDEGGMRKGGNGGKGV